MTPHIPHISEPPVSAVYLFIRPLNSNMYLISYITPASSLVCMMHLVQHDTYLLDIILLLQDIHLLTTTGLFFSFFWHFNDCFSSTFQHTYEIDGRMARIDFPA